MSLAILDEITDPKVLVATEAVINRILDRRKLEFYQPYPKQLAFHAAGGEDGVRERLLMAANQVGKTLSAASETAYHLTGEYPDWWDGIRWEKPVASWCGSDTGENTRDNPQRLLMGRPGEWGSGQLPSKSIIQIKRKTHGVEDAIGTVLVQHKSGGQSSLTFKSYDQGRERWQGETLNFVWFDEEPPLDVYTEGLTRTNATDGVTYLTFTPMKGVSDVVRRFMVERVIGTKIISMTIDDALHYTEAQRRAIIASYPEHERQARAKGIPIMGSGLVFPVDEASIKEAAFAIPGHWPRLAGMDIGYDHPTAVIWEAWDRDADVVHVYDAYRLRLETPAVHSVAIKARGAWIPVAWPHDALQHDKGGSCEQIASQYRKLGVAMLKDKATHPPADGQQEGDGGYGLEAGIQAMLDRMRTGRYKVAANLNDWFEEMRLYHRKDGLIVKEGDDLMSASRVGVMMLRKAVVAPVQKRAIVHPFQPSDAAMGVLG